MNKQPHINVGILTKSEIQFKFNGVYKLEETQRLYEGEHTARWKNGKIAFDGKLMDRLSFSPLYYQTASFDLYDVSIGIQFHWERTEIQTFQGTLLFVTNETKLVAINSLLLEDYLLSVISSEMNATSSSELLKAHAVISRSWLLAQLNKKNTIQNENEHYESCRITNDEIVRWYDREEHDLFDVCADDHCQRYQGITKASTPLVKDAINNTYGEVLMSENTVCDARFSKCCGGITELFENCWEPKHFSYLESVPCSGKQPEISNWDEWIMSSPPAFCNTKDEKILSQILNNYDQETNDFFRWKIAYSQQEIAALISKKTSLDFGDIIDLIPQERGESGRIIRLLVVGTKKELYIGKELEIRKILSESHLYSSAFVVKKEEINNGIPQRFVLHGAGWGHGVGLCQIGAAMMAEQAYKYHEILAHYFKGASLEKLYHA